MIEKAGIILLGSTEIGNIYLGSANVSAIYIGSILIWPNSILSNNFVTDKNEQFVSENPNKPFDIIYDDFGQNYLTILTEAEQKFVNENGYWTLDYDELTSVQPDENTVWVDNYLHDGTQFALLKDSNDALINYDQNAAT